MGDSYICTKLVSITEFFLEDELDFKKIQEQDNTYCTKFLYITYQDVEKYTESARRDQLCPTALYFDQIKAAIEQGAFTVHLLTKV